MPIIFIPNAYELYSEDSVLDNDQAIRRLLYHCRFMWLMKPGDIIILPETPSKAFLEHFCETMGFSLSALNVVIWKDAFNIQCCVALENSLLIRQLKKIMENTHEWTIQACYFNKTILKLADRLCISIEKKFRQLIDRNGIKKLNSKAYFREMAEQYQLQITRGSICYSLRQLKKTVKNLMDLTGQLVIKQAHNASGRGNIGLSFFEKKLFFGVSDVILIKNKKLIDNVLEDFWASRGENYCFIVEVYYPNTGSFTIALLIPEFSQSPQVLYESKIRMEDTWVGVEIPADTLSDAESDFMRCIGLKIALILQDENYHGYLCCDFIQTDCGLLLTEINVRPGAETNAHAVAAHILGQNYHEQYSLITRRNVITDNFLEKLEALKKRNLLLRRGVSSGIAFLSFDKRYGNAVEYLILEKNLQKAYALEKFFLNFIVGQSAHAHGELEFLSASI